MKQIKSQKGCAVYLSISRLSGRLQLFKDGDLVLSRDGSAELPYHFELKRGACYKPVYDNNAGGEAYMHVVLAQHESEGWGFLDYEFDLQLEPGPQVKDLPEFKLQDRDPFDADDLPG